MIRANLAQVERDPIEIAKFIDDHTISSNNADYLRNDSVKLLDRVARRAIRYFYLREHGDDDEGSVLLKDQHWPVVKQVLMDHQRIDMVTKKAMHGRPAPLIRIKNPKELLDWARPETISILDALISS